MSTWRRIGVVNWSFSFNSIPIQINLYQVFTVRLISIPSYSQLCKMSLGNPNVSGTPPVINDLYNRQICRHTWSVVLCPSQTYVLYVNLM